MFSAPAACPGICEGLVLQAVLWEALCWRRQTLETASHHLCQHDSQCKIISATKAEATECIRVFASCTAHKMLWSCPAMWRDNSQRAHLSSHPQSRCHEERHRAELRPGLCGDAGTPTPGPPESGSSWSALPVLSAKRFRYTVCENQVKLLVWSPNTVFL